MFAIARRLTTSVTWAGLMLLTGIRSAPSQEISPLTVTGTANSQIQLIETNAPASTWTLFGNNSSFVIREGAAGFPFQINAGAASGALSIGSDGKILIAPGFGAVAPARQLHVYAHDTPGIRLEDHATQSFDLGLIESCFCIVDVTDGNLIPFTICPNAPTDSMFIASTGHVGLGTSSPQTLLHARKPAEVSTAEILARFDVADDANGRLEISNVSSTNGVFHPRLRGTTSAQAVCLTMEGIIADDIGSNPVVSFAAAKSAGGGVVNRPLVTFRNNVTVRATIAANGDVFATSFNPTSSRSTKDNIVDLDSARAADALRNLTPVEYVYKDDPTAEQRVGFIAEDVPEIVANADRKSVPIMDVLALVTRVVKDQQQTIDEQKKVNDELKMANDAQRKLNEELLNRLNQLERQMQEKK